MRNIISTNIGLNDYWMGTALSDLDTELLTYCDSGEIKELFISNKTQFVKRCLVYQFSNISSQ